MVYPWYRYSTIEVVYDLEKGGWTDEDIFQRARVITFRIVQKIRLQDFVSDSVSHARNHARLPYCAM